MAGSDARDNPVAINVIPMVDVIFCLCVFFMCSFRFVVREGEHETWLPKTKGSEGPVALEPLEVRVVLTVDPRDGRVVTRLGLRTVADLAVLERELAAASSDVRESGRATPCVIDAEAGVPWESALAVLDTARASGFAEVEFALSTVVR